MKPLITLFFSLLLLLSLHNCSSNSSTKQNHTPTYTSDDKVLQEAYQKKLSEIQIHGIGEVIKLLPDDIDNIRHQHFILQLHSGQTLLITHNIDIATKIDTLTIGDTVEFYGEYIWNDKGGVVHWTHHDPNSHHEDGWLKHQGITYE